MIDSGADVSIFPKEIGEKIGLTIKNEREQPLRGIGGSIFKTYLHDIIFEIGGWKFNKVIISKTG